MVRRRATPHAAAVPRPKALSFTVPAHLSAIAAAQRNLAANLKRLRATRRFSQEKLAEVAEMSTAYISGLERAEARSENPSLATLAVLAVALGCTVGELVDGPSPPAATSSKQPTGS